MGELDRYIRQTVFQGLGEDGQKRLLNSRVLLAGCGALGSAIAVSLVRSGVGHLRIVDQDVPELVNLHRQFLYDEENMARRIPKAVVAAEKLSKANSQVKIEPVVTELRPENIEKLAEGADLILDGTDNLQTRYLINDYAVKNRIPWIYGGVFGASGMMMVILPGKSACLRCLFPEPPQPGQIPTCETVGVLNPAPMLIAALESIEAIKLLAKSGQISGGVFNFDLWEFKFTTINTRQNPKCPACGQKKFEFLQKRQKQWTAKLCGKDAVKITPPGLAGLDLQKLRNKLAAAGKVEYNGWLLEAELEGLKTIIFPDGRAIIHGTVDESKARALYRRYLGR